MGLETAAYVEDLNALNPDGTTDAKSQGDDHLKLIKSALKATFPGMAGRFKRVQSKSGNYTGLATDNTSLLMFTAVATLALTAAATLGNGWSCTVYAKSADVTIDPNASETVDDQATFVIPRGSAGTLLCDGSNFLFFGWEKGGGWSVGDVKSTARTTADDGWLLCFGQAISRTTYADLFAAISTTHGVGDGSTTFNVPDIRGRGIAGKDDMGGTSANRLTGVTGGVDGDVLGGTGGEEAHALTAAEASPHTHTFSATTSGQSADHTHPGGESATQNLIGGTSAAFVRLNVQGANNTGGASNDHTHTVSGTTDSGGSGTAHNNVQPTIVLNYAIKY